MLEVQNDSFGRNSRIGETLRSLLSRRFLSGRIPGVQAVCQWADRVRE
jgi:hypothetical protein